MKLWAISDLHVGFRENREVVTALTGAPDDWLILAGDLGETVQHLRWVFGVLRPRFRQLVWVPGNHELWTVPHADDLRGQAKYESLVALCREHGVLTPEDPYAFFDDGHRRHCLAPLFTLYDHSFCPEGMTPEQARAWAMATGVDCVDAYLLHADPHKSLPAWCEARCAETERRLQQSCDSHPHPLVLINHFPLLGRMARLPRAPAMSIWCGTRRTDNWPQRFRASVVVTGHLHLPRTQRIDGIRFEEVSLGYPREWRRSARVAPTLRQILPDLAVGAPSRCRYQPNLQEKPDDRS